MIYSVIPKGVTMFNDISVFHFLIFAVTIGFIAAIVYTNIQRTALSKFIIYLVDNNCDGPENAVSCNNIGLKPIECKIVSSAVAKQHGMRRCIGVIKDGSSGNDSLSDKMEGISNSFKYYLLNCNKDELLKKYSFKPMSTSTVILFITILAAVVFAVTSAVDWLISYVSIPKINDEKTDTPDDEISSEVDDATIEDEQNTNIADDESVKPSGPRIPV